MPVQTGLSDQRGKYGAEKPIWAPLLRGAVLFCCCTAAAGLLQGCCRKPRCSGGSQGRRVRQAETEILLNTRSPHSYLVCIKRSWLPPPERKVDYVLSHSFSPSFMPIPIIRLTGYVVISGGGAAQAHKHNLSGRNVVKNNETGDFLLQTKSSGAQIHTRALQVHN